MSNIFFISDHHFGHKKVIEFEKECRPFEDIKDHDDWLIAQHNSRIGKNDTVWFCGDVGFNFDSIDYALPRLSGNKNMIYGNHDNLGLEFYKSHFSKVRPFREYKGWLVSHMPVHHSQVKQWGGRYEGNLHGHTHSKNVDCFPYVNMCVEQCEGIPLTFAEWTDHLRWVSRLKY